MAPGLCFAAGTMFIQVRSVLLSQECDVMVDPSTEAALPTSTLVHPSHVGQNRASCSCSLLAAPGSTSRHTAATAISTDRERNDANQVNMAGLLKKRGPGPAGRRSIAQGPHGRHESNHESNHEGKTEVTKVKGLSHRPCRSHSGRAFGCAPGNARRATAGSGLPGGKQGRPSDLLASGIPAPRRAASRRPKARPGSVISFVFLVNFVV